MRKLAAFAAVAMIAAVCLTAAPLVITPDFAFAQEVVAVDDPSPWADFWAALQAPLAVFVMAVLGLLGSIVSYYARKIGGAQAEAIANGAYQILIDQAAGWLAGEKKEGRAPTIDDAVSYIRGSYPEVVKHEPSAAKLGDDIIGALGRLKN